MALKKRTSAKTSNVLNGASVGIPPRHIDFQFPDTTPKYFYADNATATTFFAMLSCHRHAAASGHFRIHGARSHSWSRA